MQRRANIYSCIRWTWSPIDSDWSATARWIGSKKHDPHGPYAPFSPLACLPCLCYKQHDTHYTDFYMSVRRTDYWSNFHLVRYSMTVRQTVFVWTCQSGILLPLGACMLQLAAGNPGNIGNRTCICISEWLLNGNEFYINAFVWSVNQTYFYNGSRNVGRRRWNLLRTSVRIKKNASCEMFACIPAQWLWYMRSTLAHY